MANSPAIVAVCERCHRLFHRFAGKFCDVPTCNGYLHYLDRGRG